MSEKPAVGGGPTRGRDATFGLLSVQYLGHAGFVVEAEDVRVMIDPWFHSAFLRSWFPWPDNGHLLRPTLERGCDYLYVSHTHEDHLDRSFLTLLPKDVVVLCPAFRSKSVKRELIRLGFTRFVEMGHDESVQLGQGVTATMILDTSHKEDSALMLEARGVRFLDLNDCHPRLSEMPRNVDLLAAQFSGAMWYPNCYDYPESLMETKVSQVRANLLDTLVRTCEATDARTYLPCAGPPCFLDPVLDRYNDSATTIFPRWHEVAAEFRTRLPAVELVELRAGQTSRHIGDMWTAESGHEAPTEPLDDYRVRRKLEWERSEAGGKSYEISTGQLTSYFAALVRKNSLLAGTVQTTLRIVTEHRAWKVDLPEGTVSEADGTDHAARYCFELPAWVLHSIVSGEVSWEEALLSMRIRLRRDPDVFDMTLFGLLRYGRQPVQTRQMLLDIQGTDEFIERDGYRIQRYCPHAGEDLRSAIICGATLECPRHHWSWDLRTGQCIAGGSLTLAVEPAAVDTESVPCQDPA